MAWHAHYVGIRCGTSFLELLFSSHVKHTGNDWRNLPRSIFHRVHHHLGGFGGT